VVLLGHDRLGPVDGKVRGKRRKGGREGGKRCQVPEIQRGRGEGKEGGREGMKVLAFFSSRQCGRDDHIPPLSSPSLTLSL